MDALTNVVIAMVFVIVVLAIALSFAAQLMGKRVAEEMVKQHSAAAAASAAASAAAAAAAAVQAHTTVQEAAPRSGLPGRTHIAVQGNERAASAAGGRISKVDNLLQLDFADAALTLDSAAAQRLREALANGKAAAPQARVQIVAVGPALELTENQRSAYVRVMAVRNELLDQGYAASRIGVRIDTASKAAHPAVTISITAP
ncbi:MAG: OadG family protein [Burkholderiales bacterium]|nr:OadG family protein [Burkholderiales bacterium]